MINILDAVIKQTVDNKIAVNLKDKNQKEKTTTNDNLLVEGSYKLEK